MKNQEKRPCPLCERHQRMETTNGMLFWVEWGEDGNPRLCTDTLHDGGGLNVLCIDFCPLCGREMENRRLWDEKTAYYTALLRPERCRAGAAALLRTRKTEAERLDDHREETGNVLIACILAAIYDEYGIGEMRLRRVVDCANEFSAKYALDKQVRGEKQAKATLAAAVQQIMPPFLLPALSAPKTEREAVQLAARREAADTVMKIYVQAMHKALGFGADRVAVVAAETEGNFRQFGECTKDGEYYGYAVLARKIGQIIHDTVEVDTSGATEPVFGKTLF